MTRRLLPSFLLALLFSTAIANAVPTNNGALRQRHDGEDDDDDDGYEGHHMHNMGDMDGMDMTSGTIPAESSTSNIASASTSVSIPTTTALQDTQTQGSSHSHSHSHHASDEQPPDPHAHHSHHAPVKEYLDDADIHYWHEFPPTYLAADFGLDNTTAFFGEVFDDDWDPLEAQGHKGLMVAHVAAMCVAYFGALPIALGLRAADHPSHLIANGIFLVVALLGWLAGVWYKAATPDRYEGQAHGSLGNMLLLVSIGLAVLDSLGLIQRFIVFYRSSSSPLSWSTLRREVFTENSDRWLKEDSAHRYEMVGLVEHHDDEHEEHGDVAVQSQVVFAIGDDEEDEHRPVQHTEQKIDTSTRPRRPSLLIRQWTPPSRTSTGSDGTLHDMHTPPTNSTQHSFSKHMARQIGAFNVHHSGSSQSSQRASLDHQEQHHDWHASVVPAKKMTPKRFVEIVLTWVRRLQVVFAYVVLLMGIAIYTGMCRAGYINSCAAHYIKGSIFFGYGLLTFSRYLGAYADLGWAWNRAPDGKTRISAEMVECGVIFAYGITNTWMERFGAAPGSPYTVKQVQHISIAVMFWFAGLSGLLLESRRVRRLLGSVLLRRESNAVEPETYQFSYNPLPALVIAVTGLAMAAHHQDYVFQVQIHSLWGYLLFLGSLFRMITYIFLFLSPPVNSYLPSRPPTEILTAFGWASGGIVFMLSDEEIAFAAMRTGYDDMMAFLCFTVALTCLVFTWEVVVLAVKGWGVEQGNKKIEKGRRGHAAGSA